MVSQFTHEFFAGNRNRLRELFTGTAPIVLTAQGHIQRQGDAPYPFYQDASFWYFTGIDEPDVVLVMDRDKEYLIIPTRSATRVAFDGTVDDIVLKRISGIDQVFDEQEGWRRFGARLARAKHVATLPAASVYIEHFSMYANPARRQLIRKLKAYNTELDLLDISQHVARLRMVKQPLEVAAIESAIDITTRGLKQVFSGLKRQAYAYEYELEADLTRTFRKSGLRGHSFDPVIASGIRACTMHNVLNNGALVAGELVLFDVGAEYDHYAADLARTVSLGSPSRRQQAVYDAVCKVQSHAISLLKPGVIIKDYERQIEAFMGESLRELGLIKSIERETVHAFYPHATSHYLGLTPHDAGFYDEPLQPGMVMVVEPGIYIPDEEIGIRLEDDLIITEGGNRVLSSSLPTILAL
jgi:Xaa-Pro aminopeptidase